jgi:hypothetical protein
LTTLSSNKKQSKPRPNVKEALDFLDKLRKAPWTLTAIVPDGRATTETCADDETAAAFVEEHNGRGANVYYSANPTRDKMDKKATKRDIKYAEYLFVDADPVGAETKAECRARIYNVLNKYPHRPTFMIDSGNGIHLLWDLMKRVPLDSPDIIADIEARNHGLAVQFGADPSTRNIDRILRLPGTLNFPNAKKRKAGRTIQRARLLNFHDGAYAVDKFPPHAASADPETEAKAADSASGIMPKAVEALLYMPTHAPYASRSELLFGFLTGAIKAGVPPAEIIDQCLQSSGAIGKHVTDQGKGQGEAYLQRQIERAQKKSPARERQSVKTYKLLKASAVPARNPDWLWAGHLARGELELMSGETGIGKSQIQAHLVACVTTSSPWPDRTPNKAGPLNVVMVLAEDSTESTVVPRLKAWNADLDRVHFPKMIKQDGKRRMFILGEDLELLETIRREHDVALFTFDPITAYLGGGGKFNPNSTTDVRAQFGPLQDFAERTGTALSLVTHPSKSGGPQATDHFIHSAAFIAAARIGHLCLKEFGWRNGERIETGRCLFVNAKHSLTAEMPALAYTIEESMIRGVERQMVKTTRVEWRETVEITANAAVARGRAPNRMTRVDEWLKAHLADGARQAE